MNDLPSRRSFIHSVGLGFTALGLTGTTLGQDKPIQGFDDTAAEADLSTEWKSVSDRKIRVGIVGYGACRFGAAFSFQEHPNVTVAAVSDLFEDRRAALARACRCEKTYPSLEEMIKDDSIEAVFDLSLSRGRGHHTLNSRNRCADTGGQ
jgi:hypothetical protein